MKNFILQNKVIKNILIFLLWVGVWHILSLCIDEEILLVSPLSAFSRLINEAKNYDFWRSIVNSSIKIGVGFFTGSFLGILFAVLAYNFNIIREMFGPLFQFFKAVPIVSFTILAIVFMGSENLSLFISAIMAFPLIYFNLLEGLLSTDKNLLIMANIYSFSIGNRIKYIYVENLKPFILGSINTVSSLCIKAGIAAEVIGIPNYTLGEKLYNSKIYLDTSALFAYTFVIILLGYLFEKILRTIARMILYEN